MVLGQQGYKMIKNGYKIYYTPAEILNFIRDDNTELSKLWTQIFPQYNLIILSDLVFRVLNCARKTRKIDYMAFKKNDDSNKFFYAYTLEDIEKYLRSEYL